MQATGIDYLRLIETAHHTDVGRAINFSALTDNDYVTDQGRGEEHGDQQPDR